MKKVLSALVLSAAVVATAGQAFAYNGDFKDYTVNNLTLGMYDRNGFDVQKWEIGVNLGNLGVDWNFTDTNKNLLDVAPNVKNALLDYEEIFVSQGAVVNSVRVGFFMQDTKNSTYFATKVSHAPTVDYSANRQTNLNNNMKSTDNTYENNDSTIDGFAQLGYTQLGYQTKLDGSGWGTFNAYNYPDHLHAQVKIGSIVGEYQDFYLYHFVDGVLYAGTQVDYMSVLRFNKEGSVVLNPNGDPNASPVPVPAAAWLLGSGILGLVGLRRRK
jgi:hypothetical protein